MAESIPGNPPESVSPPAVPGYHVTHRLGEGGYGTVWKADDLHLGRAVALKALRVPPDVPGGAGQLVALRQEARQLAAVDHPNVVRVYAWVECAGGPFLALQYVAGGSFADRLKAEGRLPWERAAGYAADVADGLQAVHRCGVTHRDVKPANILWEPAADEAVLTDFGVSCRFGVQDRVAGSLSYIPPEALGGAVRPSNDVFALAVTLFELCTGERPFAVRSMADIRAAVGRGLPADDRRLAVVPRPLDELIRGGLDADPDRRPLADVFAARLRGLTNQLLADALGLHTAGGGTTDSGAVRIEVIRDDGTTVTWVPTTLPPDRVTRDLKRVPPPAERVLVRTGERVRVRVTARRPGYLTVFNVGPTGNLNPLWPDDPAGGGGWVTPGSLDVLDAVLTPPAGRERVVAVLSAEPLPVRLAEWGVTGATTVTAPAAYRATRDLRRLGEVVQNRPAGGCASAVLELDHQPGGA
jgi:tRNA A-37 threonylcarbamoyl transferase component Bud32